MATKHPILYDNSTQRSVKTLSWPLYDKNNYIAVDTKNTNENKAMNQMDGLFSTQPINSLIKILAKES